MGKDAVGIYFDKGYSFLVVGDFLKLHDFVVVIDRLFVKGLGEEVD